MNKKLFTIATFLTFISTNIYASDITPLAIQIVNKTADTLKRGPYGANCYVPSIPWNASIAAGYTLTYSVPYTPGCSESFHEWFGNGGHFDLNVSYDSNTYVWTLYANPNSISGYKVTSTFIEIPLIPFYQVVVSN